jgi:anti-anti-sigma factor
MPGQSPFTLHTAFSGTTAIVTLAGALDITSTPALARDLARLREAAPAQVVLHMAAVEHLDCAAAHVIAAAARDWPGPNPLVIRDPRPIVWRMLQLTGLDTAVQTDETTSGHGPRPAPPDGQQTDGQDADGQHTDGQEQLGSRQLATLLRTPVASLYQARELGLIPAPGPSGQWRPEQVAEIVHGWPRTAAAVKAARELGAARSAELLARLTGLPVTAAHVTDLAARRLLISRRSYRNRPLYRIADLHTLAADPATLDLLTQTTTPAGGDPR